MNWRQIHDTTAVWNLLDGTNIELLDDVYFKKLADSGVNAVNYTVASTEDMPHAMDVISKLHHQIVTRPDSLILGTSSDSIAQAQESGRTAIFVGLQGIEALAGNLRLLSVYHMLGLRFLQLTYQRRNLAGDGCGETEPAGLSDFGRDLVKACNDLGIVIDVSHTGFRSTIEAAQLSSHPIMATHSAAYSLVKHVRNKRDDEMLAIAEKGGLIGIAGKSSFLRLNGADSGTTLDDYVDHVDYIRDLVGVEHTAIGTDVADERRYTPEMLRGFREKYPENALGGINDDPMNVHAKGLEGPREIPNITAKLAERGYTEPDIRLVIGDNATRVFSSVVGQGV